MLYALANHVIGSMNEATINFPGYLQDMHHEWLNDRAGTPASDFSVQATLNAMKADGENKSPFWQATTNWPGRGQDPTADLTTAGQRVAEAKAFLDWYDPQDVMHPAVTNGCDHALDVVGSPTNTFAATDSRITDGVAQLAAWGAETKMAQGVGEALSQRSAVANPSVSVSGATSAVSAYYAYFTDSGRSPLSRLSEYKTQGISLATVFGDLSQSWTEANTAITNMASAVAAMADVPGSYEDAEDVFDGLVSTNRAMPASDTGANRLNNAAAALAPSTDFPIWLTAALAQVNTIANPAVDFADAQSRLNEYKAIADALAPATDAGSWVTSSLAKILSIADPAVDVSAAQAKASSFAVLVSELVPATSFGTAHAAALALITGNLFSEETLREAVDSFEYRTQGAFQRACARVSAGLFDIGAVMSSQFGMTMAAMERDRAVEVNDFEKQLRLQRDHQKAELAARYTEGINRLTEIRAQLSQAVFATQLEIDRLENALARDDAQRNIQATLQLVGQVAALQELQVRAQQGKAQAQADIDRLEHEMARTDAARKASATTALAEQLRLMHQMEIEAERAYTATQLEIDRLKHQLWREDNRLKAESSAKVVDQIVEQTRMLIQARAAIASAKTDIERVKGQLSLSNLSRKDAVVDSTVKNMSALNQIEADAWTRAVAAKTELDRLSGQLQLGKGQLDASIVADLSQQVTALRQQEWQARQAYTGLSLETTRLKHQMEHDTLSERAKYSYLLTSDLFKMYPVQFEMLKQNAMLDIEYRKTKTVALQDYKAFNIEMDVRDRFWNLDLLDRGGAFLGAMAGIPAVQQKSVMDRGIQLAGIRASLVSGVLSGVTGMMSGGMGGIGSLLGAIL